mgnify:CR=1 FL=1
MPHVVAEPCFACKYTDCVVVCPVECFYVEAIFSEQDLPEEWKPFAELNREMAPQMPVITDKKDPLC